MSTPTAAPPKAKPPDFSTLQIAGVPTEEIAATLMNTKSLSQYVDMVDKIRREVCAFCPEHFDPAKNVVVAENHRWHGWVNPYPKDGAAVHLIIAHKEHFTRLADLTPADFAALIDVIKLMPGALDIPGGALLMRFGDPTYNAGSMRHLHVNIMQPNLLEELRPPLAKTPAELAEKFAIICVFETLRLCMEKGMSRDDAFATLAPHEQLLVCDRLETKKK